MRTFFMMSLLTVPAIAFAAPQADNARAQQAAQQLEARFQQADTDQDGKLTKAEAEKGMPRLAKNFAKIDLSGNGYVTLDQVKAMGAQAAGGGR